MSLGQDRSGVAIAVVRCIASWSRAPICWICKSEKHRRQHAKSLPSNAFVNQPY